MKSHLFFLLCCLMASGLSGQQLSKYSLYREQLNVQNPAAFGREYFFEENTKILGIGRRQQWAGVEDAPVNNLFSAEFIDAEALPVVGGLGLWGVSDRTGKLGFNTLSVNFKGGIPLTDNRSGQRMRHFLSIGFSVGLTQQIAKLDKIAWRDEDDPVALNQEKAGYLDVSAGLFLYGRKSVRRFSGIRGYYIGFSAPQVFEPDPDFSISSRPVLKRQRHYFAFGGFRYKTEGENYFEPSIYARYAENVPLSVDANCRWKFNDYMWAGTGGGTSSVHLETGFALMDSQLRINFNYEIAWRLWYGHSFEMNAIYVWE